MLQAAARRNAFGKDKGSHVLGEFHVGESCGVTVGQSGRPGQGGWADGIDKVRM